ncbi:uncharacterized protein [Rutidosis leptorrhynchoides]|uniref:uncharacterized protein n=1 Tax=Rutidosis leptorrhynchoides TaxID=125765 RepID=UPI003A9994DB
MKILSFNIRDFKKDEKSKNKINWFRNLRLKELPDVVALQESKCNEVSDAWMERVWGSEEFGFIQKPKVGKSGDMFLIWDANVFTVDQAVEEIFGSSQAVRCKWKGYDTDTIITNVYGPHNDEGKKELWDSLEILMSYKDAGWVICGDFNEVRIESERLNSLFIERRAAMFNNFIEKMQLVEIPLLGKNFTRFSDDGVKLSKLDRFLVSEDFLDSWGDMSAIALDRGTSDHCPILMRNKNLDFGPKPFRIFDAWFENEEV